MTTGMNDYGIMTTGSKIRFDLIRDQRFHGRDNFFKFVIRVLRA